MLWRFIWCPPAGAGSLETGASPAFLAARSLYERYGFRYCGPFDGYADDPNSACS